MNNVPDRAALSVPEVMCALGICRDNVYKLFRTGKLPGRKIGRRTVVLIKDLDSYLQTLPKIGEPAA